MDLNVVIEENEEVRGGGGNNFLEIIETEAEAPYLINLDIIEKVRDIYVGRELLQGTLHSRPIFSSIYRQQIGFSKITKLIFKFHSPPLINKSYILAS